ncbi:CbtA family protein [Arthrobacter sp. NPDC093125]|uniref:CbtA family protein n=1 Tax=Arthrobacter sp. NPDC093125 TaxID=3363944 RepID=UPI0038298D3E
MSLTAVNNVVHLPLRSSVLRGLLAGLIAGLLAGGVAYFTGESLVDQAIAIEEAGAATHSHDSTAAGHSHGTEDGPLISREGQRAGLFLATSLTGGSFGVLLGIVWFPLSRKLGHGSTTLSVLPLAGAGWTAIAAVPWLLVPPNPPAVGATETIDYRTNLWVIAVLLGLAAVITWFVVRRWEESRPGSSVVLKVLPGLTAAAIVIVGWQLLPDSGTDYNGFPADLLWNFRLASAATQLTLWLVLGVAFQFLLERKVLRN